MKTNKIFEYTIKWTWWPIHTLTIYDTLKDNTILYYDPFMTLSWDPKTRKKTLPEEIINKIKDIIKSHPEIYKMRKVECNCVCDWNWGKFLFNNWEKIRRWEFGNLWFFKGYEDCKTKNAKILITVLDEIFEVLKSAKIPKTYLEY